LSLARTDPGFDQGSKNIFVKVTSRAQIRKPVAMTSGTVTFNGTCRTAADRWNAECDVLQSDDQQQRGSAARNERDSGGGPYLRERQAHDGANTLTSGTNTASGSVVGAGANKLCRRDPQKFINNNAAASTKTFEVGHQLLLHTIDVYAARKPQWHVGWHDCGDRHGRLPASTQASAAPLSSPTKTSTVTGRFPAWAPEISLQPATR
jgi:hypothetical protein